MSSSNNPERGIGRGAGRGDRGRGVGRGDRGRGVGRGLDDFATRPYILHEQQQQQQQQPDAPSTHINPFVATVAMAQGLDPRRYTDLRDVLAQSPRSRREDDISSTAGSSTGAKRFSEHGQGSDDGSAPKRARSDTGPESMTQIQTRLEDIHLDMSNESQRFQLEYEQGSNRLTEESRDKIDNFLRTQRIRLERSISDLAGSTSIDASKSDYKNLEQHKSQLKMISQDMLKLSKGITSVLLPDCQANILLQQQLEQQLEEDKRQKHQSLRNLERQLQEASMKVTLLNKRGAKHSDVESAQLEKSRKEGTVKRIRSSNSKDFKEREDQIGRRLDALIRRKVTLENEISLTQRNLPEAEKNIQFLHTLRDQAIDPRLLSLASSSRVDASQNQSEAPPTLGLDHNDNNIFTNLIPQDMDRLSGSLNLLMRSAEMRRPEMINSGAPNTVSELYESSKKLRNYLLKKQGKPYAGKAVSKNDAEIAFKYITTNLPIIQGKLSIRARQQTSNQGIDSFLTTINTIRETGSRPPTIQPKKPLFPPGFR